MENSNRFLDQMRPMNCVCAAYDDRSRFSAQYRCLLSRLVIVVHHRFLDKRISISTSFRCHLILITVFHYHSSAPKKKLVNLLKFWVIQELVCSFWMVYG